jgi:hypothetical protein
MSLSLLFSTVSWSQTEQLRATAHYAGGGGGGGGGGRPEDQRSLPPLCATKMLQGTTVAEVETQGAVPNALLSLLASRALQSYMPMQIKIS